MANETWKFVQAKSKQAMKQVLGIRDEAARMTVTPPLAVAPLAHGDDMRWNPNDDGVYFNPLGRYSPEHHCKILHTTSLNNVIICVLPLVAPRGQAAIRLGAR